MMRSYHLGAVQIDTMHWFHLTDINRFLIKSFNPPPLPTPQKQSSPKTPLKIYRFLWQALILLRYPNQQFSFQSNRSRKSSFLRKRRWSCNSPRTNTPQTTINAPTFSSERILNQKGKIYRKQQETPLESSSRLIATYNYTAVIYSLPHPQIPPPLNTPCDSTRCALLQFPVTNRVIYPMRPQTLSKAIWRVNPIDAIILSGRSLLTPPQLTSLYKK